jgi:hypothetical protein
MADNTGHEARASISPNYNRFEAFHTTTLDCARGLSDAKAEGAGTALSVVLLT